MKTLTSLLLTAIFAFGILPAQAGQVNSLPEVQKAFSMKGDGIDNRFCAELKKQGKEPAGMCF
ncbi:hypothetical protein [Zobellella aerophila]|uniref:Uncharacterized protein n=1 Tax=Zobellella aerophila TaxID=870480 RepID=A0ABP6V7Y2_9GAMM